MGTSYSCRLLMPLIFSGAAGPVRPSRAHFVTHCLSFVITDSTVMILPHPVGLHTLRTSCTDCNCTQCKRPWAIPLLRYLSLESDSSQSSAAAAHTLRLNWQFVL